MKRKIAIIISFFLLILTVIPFTYGFQNNQFHKEATNNDQLAKDTGSIDIAFQVGWPQKTTGKVDSSPVIADLDSDGGGWCCEMMYRGCCCKMKWRGR